MFGRHWGRIMLSDSVGTQQGMLPVFNSSVSPSIGTGN
jgi:hypothetical protein